MEMIKTLKLLTILDVIMIFVTLGNQNFEAVAWLLIGLVLLSIMRWLFNDHVK